MNDVQSEREIEVMTGMFSVPVPEDSFYNSYLGLGKEADDDVGEEE